MVIFLQYVIYEMYYFVKKRGRNPVFAVDIYDNYYWQSINKCLKSSDLKQMEEDLYILKWRKYKGQILSTQVYE
jgi:hypothetical protein